MKKALPIAEDLYLESSILFMFDNATNYLIYVKDALWAHKINKRPNDKEIIFCYN